jgi:prepilin-type N-terminal cleavage/methylation domain-containing protein
MSKEHGMTMVELLLVLAIAALVLTTTTVYSIPWLQKEEMRSSVYKVQTYMQLARIEAVSRNQECRFVIDTSNGTLTVLDANGTPSNRLDDLLLYESELPETVSFARPDAGSAVSLSQIASSTKYQTRFKADGTVLSGSGEVVLFGGERYGKISVFVAGGIQVRRWDGANWASGT